MKKFFVVLLAFSMTITTLVGCGVNRDNLYDPANNEIALADFFFKEESEYSDADFVIAEEKAYIDAICDAAEEVGVLENEYIRELKDEMIDFFNYEFGIDVSEKINNVETKLIEVSDSNVWGYHIPGTNVVCVNQDLYQMRDYFPFTWCHEVIHYLGISNNNNEYWALYETLTEAVTIQLMWWLEAPYTLSAYYNASLIGSQMLIANPEIVTKLIIDEKFSMEDHINEVLKDAVYPVANLPEDTNIAFQLDSYLMCMIEMNQLYCDNPLIMNFMLQEIATAYCRKFDLTEEQIKMSRPFWLLQEFDLVTIKKSGDYYVLKG